MEICEAGTGARLPAPKGSRAGAGRCRPRSRLAPRTREQVSARLAQVWVTGGWDPPIGVGLQLAGLACEGKLGRQGNSAQTGLIPFPFLFFFIFLFGFLFS